MSIDRDLQNMADRMHLKSQIDDMGPHDYAVLIRLKYMDDECKTGTVLVHRCCFSHVALGLMDEARQILRHDHDE
jgi:hypothetical protein